MAMAKDKNIGAAVVGGINFLETRKEFWRQQKPLYQRQFEERQRLLSARSTRPPSSRTRRLRPLGGASTARDRTSTGRPGRGPRRPRSAAGRRGLKQRRQNQRRPPTGNTRSKEQYFQATRYAIQTLENVNNALEYDSPELGLQLAKNFLSRIDSMELADKPRILGNLYCSMGNTYLALGKLTLAAIHHRKGTLSVSCVTPFELA